MSAVHRAAIALGMFALVAGARSADAQASLGGGLPGAWVEVNALAQRVTNGYGDWRGASARAVLPGTRDTWYADALALEAFGERGVLLGVTHRHDWSSRWFQTIGVAAGTGAPIFPRARADVAIGRRWGSAGRWQTTAGASYVKSISAIDDVAATANVAWYAPGGLLLDAGVRYNVSRPGDIESHRVSGVAVWTPSPRRSLSARAIAGTEGYQLLDRQRTLSRFASQEYALAWRERVGGPWAVSVQGDAYRNPYYTRTGVTLGVARYW